MTKDEQDKVRAFRDAVDRFLTSASNPGRASAVIHDNTAGSAYHDLVMAKMEVDAMVCDNTLCGQHALRLYGPRTCRSEDATRYRAFLGWAKTGAERHGYRTISSGERRSSMTDPNPMPEGFPVVLVGGEYFQYPNGDRRRLTEAERKQIAENNPEVEWPPSQEGEGQ